MKLASILKSGFILLSIAQLCLCQLPSYSLDTPPSSVAVNRDSGEVFIVAGTQLLRLSSDLDLQESVAVSGELVRIALSPDGGRLVGCLGGESRTCLVYNTSHLASGAIATVEDAHYNPENGLAIITTDDSFYLGSEGSVEDLSNDNMFLAQYNYTSHLVRSTAGTGRYRVENSNFVRQFYGGVTRNGYVYYFVTDEEPDAIRVLRVCDCARQPCTTEEWEALYELTIECRSSADETTRVCGVELLESYGGRTEPLVVVTRCEDGGFRNRVCAFLLSDIDSDMDEYYTECVDGDRTSTELPWTVSRSCSEFSVSSEIVEFSAPCVSLHLFSQTLHVILAFLLELMWQKPVGWCLVDRGLDSSWSILALLSSQLV